MSLLLFQIFRSFNRNEEEKKIIFMYDLFTLCIPGLMYALFKFPSLLKKNLKSPKLSLINKKQYSRALISNLTKQGQPRLGKPQKKFLH